MNTCTNTLQKKCTCLIHSSREAEDTSDPHEEHVAKNNTFCYLGIQLHVLYNSCSWLVATSREKTTNLHSNKQNSHKKLCGGKKKEKKKNLALPKANILMPGQVAAKQSSPVLFDKMEDSMLQREQMLSHFINIV